MLGFQPRLIFYLLVVAFWLWMSVLCVFSTFDLNSSSHTVEERFATYTNSLSFKAIEILPILTAFFLFMLITNHIDVLVPSVQ